MKKSSIKKVLKYRPPVYISLMVIVMTFLLFLYISSNHKSYAMEKNIEFLDSIELVTTEVITSDTLTYNNKQISSLRVYKSNSNGYQNFSLNNKYNYANSYIKQEKITDPGLIYILSNSYPNKNFVDENGNNIDDSFQTWITQTSIWLYLYEKELSTKGSIAEDNPYYLDNDTIYSIKHSKKLLIKNKEFKTEDTIYNLYIKKIVDNALIKNNDKQIILDYFKEDKLYSTKNNKYYQTSEIKIITNDSENFKNYTLNIENAPKGTKIVNQDGKIINENTILDVTDTFYIRIPKNAKIDKANVDIIVTGIFDGYEGFIYKNEGYKDIVMFNIKDNKIINKLKITI